MARGETCGGLTFARRQDDRGYLFQCDRCKRVARTTRPHQVPGKNTASHDKTMGFLWDSAIPA